MVGYICIQRENERRFYRIVAALILIYGRSLGPVEEIRLCLSYKFRCCKKTILVLFI